ncbi:MAG: two-component sensor histidine kinase [Chloroflexi bacterium]|nr:MAG: two-component sensor histidine kinase [Chloroflexota bacterium]
MRAALPRVLESDGRSAGLAVLVTTFVTLVSSQQVGHVPGAPPLDRSAYALLLGTGPALALHRRLPLFAYAATLALALIYLLGGHPPGPVYLPPFVALILLEGRVPLRLWAPAAALGAGLLALGDLSTGGTLLAASLWAAGWLAAAILVAAALIVRRRFAAEARAREELARRTREEESRRRTAEERLRIAREMHDVLGHSLAVISLQAGVAEHLLDGGQDEVRSAVVAIRRVSRQALSELRTELAVLRGAAGPGSRSPAPGLDALSGLGAAMRDAGLPVDLSLDVEADAVPEIVAGAAYRIVQESLTNVARHAGPGARASVRVARDGDRLEVEVVDNGRGAPAGGGAPGSGISGMAERAAALGGECTAANRPEGGFRVRALLPWNPT